jgi:glycosyltransferase involved in cell wall biosynthesis
MSSNKATLSVVIITFNESKNIARCIHSVKNIADEVVVLDSFSTDNTCDIARELGARVEQHAFDGHIQQKNRAWQMANSEWVLSLDADEALDEVLVANIAKLLANVPKDVSGFTMNRLTNYCGTWVRHSGWYPDTKLRLFLKGHGAWGGVNPHDRFELHANRIANHITGDILHYSYYTREDHLKQIEYFSNIASKELFQKGIKVSVPLIGAKVALQFIKTYFLKAGFLDGATGFTIARLSAFATYTKYTKLRALYSHDEA